MPASLDLGFNLMTLYIRFAKDDIFNMSIETIEFKESAIMKKHAGTSN